MTGSAALEIADVAVALGGTPILHGVSMTVAAGEWLTIIGPNGAGKSTLLRAVGGAVPYGGTISLLGRPVGQLRRRDRARLVATVPQNPVVPPGMTVLDYVLLGRTPYIRPLARESRHDLDVVDGVLCRLDLLGLADRPLETLSGGERQRVFLGRALAQGATLLMLDEPTSSLDIGHQQEVLDLVDELRRDRGLTVVATMHELSIAGEYADRMVLLSRGRVEAVGTPAQVLTEDALARHYGARVRVLDGEQGPLIIPVRGPRDAPA
jgi:iron complex transport system ATP-binding protein